MPGRALTAWLLRVGCARVAVGLLATAATAALPATAAAPRPDVHDRALAAELNAKVATFRTIAHGSADSELQTSIDRCPAVKNDPTKAFAAAIVLIPVLLARIVEDYGPQIGELRDAMAAMHPHAPLFRSWLAAETDSVTLLLRFDNHGKQVELCRAVTVLLDKRSTDADIYRVTGLHATLIASLFESKASAKLTKIDARMRAFFVAAGLSRKDARALTS